MSRLGYLALGVDEVQRLGQDLVLDLTVAEIIGLGRAVYDRRRAAHPEDGDLVLDPVGMAILDQIAAERERNPFLDQVQSRPELHPETAEDARVGVDRGLDREQHVHAEHDQVEKPSVRNGEFDRKRYWEHLTKDRPDDDWR